MPSTGVQIQIGMGQDHSSDHATWLHNTMPLGYITPCPLLVYKYKLEWGKTIHQIMPLGYITPCPLLVYTYKLEWGKTIHQIGPLGYTTPCPLLVSSDWSFMVDPLSYFLLQLVLHIWCNKGHKLFSPVNRIVHIKDPWKSIPWSGDSRFPLYLCVPLPYVQCYVTK